MQDAQRVDGERRTHQLMGGQRGLRFDRCTVAPRGACILHRCLARKQAASWRFWGGCLGALATGVVPLTFDNNVDVASYYLLVLFLSCIETACLEAGYIISCMMRWPWELTLMMCAV